MAKDTISTPPQQAGIFGVSAGTNTMGWKFSPRAVVVFAILLILIIKVMDYVVYHTGI
ncbi:Uncharacterised protein [uncultured archaeon]|nr:Uncharacterised protein [uncultured archaeon]